MKEMVYLDGELVDSKIIDPAKHRFVGTFRKPWEEHKLGGYILCSCGEVLQTVDRSYAHWQLGHWDYLQYITIQPSGPRVKIPDDPNPSWIDIQTEKDA